MAIERKYIQLFQMVLHDLNQYSGNALWNLAVEAEVSVQCLYHWKRTPPVNPQIRTVFNVAEALGYKIDYKRPRRLKAVA